MENPNQQPERLNNIEMLMLIGIDVATLPAELNNAVKHHGITEDEFRAIDPKVVLVMFSMFSLGAQSGAVATIQKIARGAARRLADMTAQADKASQN